MLSVAEWLTDLSNNYSVQQVEDTKGGIFVERIKGDIYLIKHTEVKAE